MRTLLLVLAVFSWSTMWAASAAAQTPPNILLVVADDVGAEMIGAYNGSSGHPHTPRINDLASGGVRFSNAWANPVCAATRATFLTGRYGHRTNVRGPTATLQNSEQTIPEVLRAAGSSYQSAVFGKWGVGNTTVHAVQSGFDHYAGNPAAILDKADSNLALNSYRNWVRHEATFVPGQSGSACDPADPASHQNGSCISSSTSNCIGSAQDPTACYATIINVNDAESWISGRPNDAQPWFVVLAFNAAHSPYHRPPDGLHDMENDLPPTGCAAPDCYRAMVESMDTKIGELLDWLDAPAQQELAQTIVIFVGDNGSPGEIEPNDPDRSKGTLFQGGVTVPLVIAGPGVTAGVSDALVNTSDLFMTVLDVAGVADEVTVNHDSYSLVPILEGATDAVRHYAYAEVGFGNTEILIGGKAIRNRVGFKLQVDQHSGEALQWHFSDLNSDLGEGENLVDIEAGDLITANPSHQAQLDDLKEKLGDPLALPTFPAPTLLAANIDWDQDLVPDTIDNCRVVHQSEPEQCDHDSDGYGNVCDADFDQNFTTNASEYSMYFIPAFKGWDPPPWPEGVDMDCNGAVNSIDYSMYFLPAFTTGAQPGPSGLACAGTVPCAP